MSKLARALTLAAMVAAMNLAGMTALAQAHPTDQATAQQTRHPVTSPQQAAADAAHRRLLAQERSYSTSDYGDPAIQQALAQERFYSSWSYGNTSAPAPAEPGGQAGWLTPALGVLAAVMTLVAGAAVVAARRANRSQRAGQAA
jgi:hypothetical protein